ncbi:MAG TPA: pilus assembly protein TadG-related protein [Gemmatimonadaceae bacterium]|nr:pilus assembly protein TadG-related protein [Gemmatimonadaceae bacterium]
MQHRRSTTRWMHERMGATLVLVCILITVLLGFTGVAFDFGRMYLFRTQLQTTSDAAALAAIVDLQNGSPETAQSTAISYVPLNPVGNDTAAIGDSDVVPGHWDFDAGTFSALEQWTDPALNAVRVTGHYPAAFTFGHVFGATSVSLRTTSVAAVGAVSFTSCLKPWAVSYQTLLDQLYPPAGTKDPSYDLTEDDVTRLAAMSYPADSVALLESKDNTLSPGNIAAVQVNDPWDGNKSYKEAIQGTCANMSIGPGTVLSGDPGEGGGQTANALKQFCDDNGGTTQNGNGFSCDLQPRVKLAMWSTNNGESGANLRATVKYVGVFAIAGFNKGAGKSKPDEVAGYFTAMAAPDGAFSLLPGPLKKGVLVQ